MLRLITSVIFLATGIYLWYGLMFYREIWFDSDFHRIIDELSTVDINEYHLREAFFWIPGKFFYHFFNESIISILDFSIFLIIFYFVGSLRKIPLVTLALFSPFVLLGLTNIYRQFIAFAVFLVILIIFERNSKSIFSKRYSGIFLFLPGFLHNSLFFYPLISKLITNNKTKKFFLFSFMFGLGIFLWSYYPDFYREGTDVSTPYSMFLLYGFVWIIFLFSGRSAYSVNLMWQQIISMLGSMFFLLFGSSSGSRLILMTSFLVCLYAIKFRRFAPALFAVLLSITPSFYNATTKQILSRLFDY